LNNWIDAYKGQIDGLKHELAAAKHELEHVHYGLVPQLSAKLARDENALNNVSGRLLLKEVRRRVRRRIAMVLRRSQSS
jgi:hypothetical protein